MKSLFLAFTVGVIFAVGLSLSGMTEPAKVIGFLDLFGNWDPTLAFVMGGAIGVHFFAYRWIRGRASPVFATKFEVPSNSSIDKNLCIGAILFGAGWGLAGYCPGPAFTSLVTLKSEVLVFVVAMVAGMYLHHVIRKKNAS